MFVLFQKLTKGKDSWSLAEVVHALVILAHFHSLCSFVFSCGLNQELDEAKGYNFKGDMTYEASAFSRTSENSSSKANPKDEPQKNHKDWNSSTTTAPPSPTEPEVGITTLMQRMKTLSEKPEESNPVELAKRFESIETQSAEIRVSQPRIFSVVYIMYSLFLLIVCWSGTSRTTGGHRLFR